MQINSAASAAGRYTRFAAVSGKSAGTPAAETAAASETPVTDVVDLSAAGRAALAGTDSTETADASASSGKSYDLAKVLEIREKRAQQTATQDEIDYYWNARESDPSLDSQLYEQDKAEVLSFVSQVQNILMKAVSGQKLTAEEQKMVDGDPALRQEIELRKSRAQIVE